MAGAIARMEHNAADLRDCAVKSRDGAQSRRLLAIAMALDGSSRGDAARQAGMDGQTPRDWVHRRDEIGADGLVSRCAPGPTPKLAAARMGELRAVALAGPDPAAHHVVRWRRAELRDEVTRRFGVTAQERAIGERLRKPGLTRLRPRPCHPKKDPAAEEAFKKTSVAC